MPAPAHLPPAVRTDSSNAFAHNTMRVRVPATIRAILDQNPDYPPSVRGALEALQANIATNGPIPPLTLPAPDHDAWAAAWAPHAHETWHATDWFFAEVYTYRLILQAVRWWETARDPYAPVKRAEEQEPDLWTMVDSALAADGPQDERLMRHLHGALWGNRIDLSYAPSTGHGTAVTDDDLLVDDSPRLVEHLMARDDPAGRGPVHLVADNYGRELAMDLVLLDTLLDGLAESAVLHVKFHPTFVSDATVPDVLRFLGLMRARGGAIGGLGTRLTDALETGRLRLAPDPFWNSTRFLWDMPPRLHDLFRGAPLVILKGDLNYRRMVGDALWPDGTPFSAVADSFPAPLAAMRSLKSDPIIGLPRGMMARLDALDAEWHFNGKRGVLQSNL